MEKLVPIGKKSKKEQKAYHLKQRRTWGDMKPIGQMRRMQRIRPSG